MGETCSIKLIMMEFTWHGFVRHGFGFHNPNHAAALICALMPFLWGWKRHPLIGWFISCMLLPPLILTFSRTGLIVLLLELAAWLTLSHKTHWRCALFLCMTALTGAFLGGLASRFQLDGAIANRPRIWIAGLKLFAANPLGIGLGESGRVASAFLLDGIQCRTLINSHLTLLVEFGLFTGIFWGFFIVHALSSGRKLYSVKCSFLGLSVSGWCSSVFDWHVLFDLRNMGGLGKMNYLFSWMTLILFLTCGVCLVWFKTPLRRFCVEAVITAMFVSIPFILYSSETPHISEGFACRESGHMNPVLVLYTDDWSFEEVVPFFQGIDSYIPLHGWNNKSIPKFNYQHDTVWLFSNCAEYAYLYPDAKLIFVSPPDYYQLPSNTDTVYLKRFSEEMSTNFKVQYY